MKSSNKSSIITGVVLLLLAALFSISLILQPLNLVMADSGQNNIFYLLGDMLFSVYGFSSLFIPAFLLISGLSCFASKWTARKTMRLLTAIVPFFTAVITENICRSILALENSSFVPLKLTVSLITGLMLIIIEYLGVGIIADKINSKSHVRIKSDSDVDTETKQDDLSINRIKVPEILQPDPVHVADENNFGMEEIVENHVEIPTEDVTSENVELQTGIAEEEYEEETVVSEQQPTEVVNLINEIQQFSIKSENVVESDEKSEEVEQKEAEQEEVPESESKQEIETENPASIITQEEYALLTTQEEEPVDELEWPDLPPVPEKLPPEYDEDAEIEEQIDENDPSLQFPPVQEEEPKESQPVAKPVFKSDLPTAITIHEDSESLEDEVIETKKSEYPSKIRLNEQTESFDVNSQEDYEDEKTVEIDLQEDSQPVFESEKDLTSESAEKKTTESFPKKISIRDELAMHGNNTPGVTLKPLASSVAASKMPSSSTFSKVFDDMENDIRKNYETYQETSVEEENLEPSFDDESVYNDSNADFYAEFIEDESAGFDESEFSDDDNEDVGTDESEVVADSFFDSLESEIDEESDDSDVSDEIIEENADFSSIDIMNQFDDSEIVDEDDVEEVESDPNIDKTATNLTKDDLTDFFNAQQEENTPKTKEIAANPPKITRATKKGPYVIPSDLLIAYKDDQYWIIDDVTKQASLNLKQTLAEFGIEADIIGIKKGPVVTMFEILPAPGVRLQKIVQLQDNIALSLAAQSVRIVAPIPGKQAVGIEIPNKHRSIVGFREIIEMDLPEWQKMAVPVILGKDILGKAQLVDLVKTPHMLIAGATGSGKSVCVNSLILSILYKRSYQDVKLILVDPKVVELKLYNNIPHLLTPVITEPKKALKALQYCLCEMERRYALLDGMGVRDISNYNQKIKEQKICTEKLPYIVVIIDEFADLMATSGRELESIVARLTAMSRAVGIHLVLATQRPSVNVITGLIKANIPTRIAFMVASRTDSNIIIDAVGAEKLLGRGDMLYASAVDPAPVRIQGTFISDQEVEDVVRTVKEYGEPDYLDEDIFEDDEEEEGARDLFGEPMDDDDPLYDQALEIVVQAGKASASYIQRRLKIGYNRAARLVEEMEERGIVGPANGSKPREVINMP